MKPRWYLYLELYLRETGNPELVAEHAAGDEACVAALEKLAAKPAWFTDLILCLPSWQERPGAIYHPLVRRAVRAASYGGMALAWMRNLWPAWAGEFTVPVPPLAHLRPDFYLEARSILQRESIALQARQGGWNLEPYGKSEQSYLEALELTEGDRAAIQAAVNWFRTESHGLELIMPYGSSRPGHYSYPFRKLGEQAVLTTKTYRLRPGQMPQIQTPPDHAFDPSIWGIQVDTFSSGPSGPLLPAEAKLFALPQNKPALPGMNGFMVYATRAAFPAVLEAWA